MGSAGASGPLWYQLYVPGGRSVAEATIARAKAAGYGALVVTIDTPVAGLRERDFRHGVRPLLQGRFWSSLPHVGQFVRRPRWTLDFVADGAPRVFPNVELPDVGATPANVYGVRDLHGVAWEWIEDLSALLVANDSREQGDPSKMRFCGAGAVSMEQKENYAMLMRIAMLSSMKANYTSATMGFRCATDGGTTR